MIPAIYFLMLSIVIFGVGVVGVAATRHFLIMMLSVEIVLAASVILSAAVFTYAAPGNIIGFLFTIWGVASSEAIAMVAIYRYMSKNGIDMDVTKLRGLRDK